MNNPQHIPTGNSFGSSSRGKIFIISGPSGVGKTVLCLRMMEKFQPELVYSISATSRNPRGNEKDGKEYFFYTREKFEEAIKAGLFAEWALVHDNYYGTPKSFLEENLAKGKSVLMNIDVQGALKIKECFPEAVLIFILPPSIEVLEERLRKRNQDSEETLRRRLLNAKIEMQFRNEYTHEVVNDDLETTVETLEKILRSHLNPFP